MANSVSIEETESNAAVSGQIEQKPDFGSLTDVWTPYLPLILTIVGWYVVSRQHDKRERRKELRELIKFVEQRVDDVLTLATEYYALDGSNGKCDELGAKVRYRLAAMGPLQKRIRAGGLNVDATSEIVVFKQSVMGGTFESKARKKSPAGGAIVVEAAAAAGFAVIDKFETAYLDAFPVRMAPRFAIWRR